MPIQFHCDHCHGVLSIARRKAYSLIDCPKCGCKQVVPSESKSIQKKEAAVVSASERAAMGDAHQRSNERALKDLPLFERQDFENLLVPQQKTKNSTTVTNSTPIVDAVIVKPAPETTSISSPSPPTSGVELIPPRDRIILNRFHVILAAVLVFIVIGLAFGTGFMVGRTLRPHG